MLRNFPRSIATHAVEFLSIGGIECRAYNQLHLQFVKIISGFELDQRSHNLKLNSYSLVIRIIIIIIIKYRKLKTKKRIIFF